MIIITSKINLVSTRIEEIVNNMNNGKGSLAKFLDDESIYNNTNDLIVNTNSLILDAKGFVEDAQKNPKKYIKAYFAAKREDAKNK